MKCDDAAEHISALCDGATVSRAAAEHIDACETCRVRLKDYAALGAELRRAASLEFSEAPTPPLWPRRRGGPAVLLQKSWKTMRIPRLAFASMLAAIVALGSGWARQSVRASTRASVLLVQYTTGTRPENFCALSAVDKKSDSCGMIQPLQTGLLLWQVRVLSKNGEQATLGIRAQVRPSPAGTSETVSFSEVESLPQQQYVFTPGETLNVQVDGLGAVTLTGQWIDHIPAIPSGSIGVDTELDPGPDEIRFLAPLLLEGNHAVGDLEGSSATVDRPGQALDVYLKGAGRFNLALSPMPGAVEGKIQFNRIAFTLNGQSYVFVTGAPISRSRRVWVLHNPSPPTWNATGNSYLATIGISTLAPATARK